MNRYILQEIFLYEFNEKLVKKLYYPPHIVSVDKTIDAIIQRKASIARYGDGEFDIIYGRPQGFQPQNKQLARRLKEILKKNIF